MIVLKEWTFELFPENRNKTLFEAEGLEFPGRRYMHPQATQSYPMAIKAGTELKVSRIYIRQGVASYDSVTFRAVVNDQKVRFWAKLIDVNKLEVSVIK